MIRHVSSLMLCAAALLAAAACGGSGPQRAESDSVAWFTEQAAARGVGFVHVSGHEERHLMPEAVSGGGGLFDMDDDGDLDLYLVQSGYLLDRSRSEGNRLYENLGDGRFRDVSEASGADDRGYGMGLACGDYDEDGDVDLYVTNYGANVLLQNDGSGRFEPTTDAAGVGDDGFGASAGFLDYDADGDLDLYVTNYVNWSPEADTFACENKLGGTDYCGPMTYNSPARDVLYRNDGEGRFSDVTRESGLATRFGNGLGLVASDFTGDGRLDVFVANDMNPDQLWVGEAEGGFSDEALVAGVAVDLEGGRPKAGMGVTTGDVDADGDLDLMICNLVESSDSVFRNDGSYFTDVTAASGLATVSRSFTRFGVGWIDFDLDGRLDLYQANGRIMRALPEHDPDDLFAEPNLLFAGVGDGRFVEQLPRGGTDELLVGTSRGAAFGDVDNDGGVDVLVINRDAAPYLLVNEVSAGHSWLGLDVRERSGRPAEGAVVTLESASGSLRRDVRGAYSYLTCSDPRVRFPFPAEGGAAVTVRFADGGFERFEGPFERDRYIRLGRGEGEPGG